jgi:hypothetical protein
MRPMTLSLTLAAFLFVSAPPGFATQICSLIDQSTKVVLPGVVLTWDSSFHCLNAPNSGEYMVQVRLSNAPNSVKQVGILSLVLSHTTPRPRGQGPDSTAEVSGLPIMVAPDETEAFSVMGTYELVETNEGLKANLHIRAQGAGSNSSQSFQLGINVHFRGLGANVGQESPAAAARRRVSRTVEGSAPTEPSSSRRNADD